MKGNKMEEPRSTREANEKRQWRRDKIYTIQRHSASMENVSIDTPPLRGISLRLVLLSPLVSRAILPEEYNSTVLRPESRWARDDRGGKDGASRWMSNYYVTKYLLENWIMHSVGPVGGAQRIKEEEDSRRGGEARDAGDQYKESTGATRWEIQPPHHARYIHI